MEGAIRVLHALGYLTDAEAFDGETGPLGIRWTSVELAGTADAEDILGRVLVAMAITPDDDGIPAHSEGRWHHAGRDAGDLQQRLGRIRALAEDCAARSLQIRWY